MLVLSLLVCYETAIIPCYICLIYIGPLIFAATYYSGNYILDHHGHYLFALYYQPLPISKTFLPITSQHKHLTTTFSTTKTLQLILFIKVFSMKYSLPPTKKHYYQLHFYFSKLPPKATYYLCTAVPQYPTTYFCVQLSTIA